MLTIFSTPRPFHGIFDRIQRNAIQSWLHLTPKCEIILIDDEEGTTAAISEEYGLQCIRGVRQNENGTLYLDDVFNQVRKIASFDIMGQVNTDILLLSDFLPAIQSIRFPLFYLAGQRWNLDIDEPISFSGDWESQIRERIKKEGELHPPTGMDYWVFSKAWKQNMPSFLVGRPAVDNWLIQEARRAKIPTIDGTPVISIVHQNHPRKTGSPIFEQESEWNRRLAKGDRFDPDGFNYTFLLSDTDYLLASTGPKRKKFRVRKLLNYRQDIEALPGPELLWKLAFSPYRPVRWIYRQIKKAKCLFSQNLI